MRNVRFFLVLPIFLLIAVTSAKAQQKPTTCADWFAVQSWSGTITYSGSGTSVIDQNGDTATISESAVVNFTTAKQTDPCDVSHFSAANGTGIWGWSGADTQVTYSVSVHDVLEGKCVDANNNPGVETTHLDIDNGTNGHPTANIDMNFSDPTSGTYSLAVFDEVDSVTATFTGCGRSSSATESITWGPSTEWPMNGVALPSVVSSLNGNLTLTDVGAFGVHGTWTVTWNITPHYSYDVIVETDPDYSSWRPTAGRTETEESEGLMGIHVYVLDQTTGQPATGVSVDGWTVALKDVSHEPGVSMNWPSQASVINPSPPDLAFSKTINAIFPNAQISDDGTEVQFSPDPATDYNIALFLSSYDWGAWGTLNVTTEIAGQTIQAHFAGDTTTDILLPKRQPGSHVADAWKIAHGVAISTPDDDDSETSPHGEPQCNGDGLTLYEEYRGFMENGKHIEGDPKNKDFFVEDLTNDSGGGILLFTQATGLVVHGNLQKREMDPGDLSSKNPDPSTRVINFNHGAGPHVVDQHGVVVVNCLTGRGFALDGGLQVSTDAGDGLHGRPGLTARVCLQWRDQGGTLGPSNVHGGDVPSIRPVDAMQQYDFGVAHELAHSVGVDHHGSGDIGSATFTLLGPSDPRNTTGQPVFMVQGQTGLVHLLDEKTLVDRGQIMWNELIQKTPKECGSVNGIYSPELFGDICQNFVNGALPIFTDLRLYIGKQGGEHSGNDSCMMRYFFATTYQKVGEPSTYYVIDPGTEPLGSTLCPTPAGTGINGPSHAPQPRYGNATPPGGACATWVCVNDNVPPQKD